VRLAAWLIVVVLLMLGGSARGEPQKIIIDTDGDADYDDIVTVMVAAVSPELDLLGVVATGRDADRRAHAAAKALDVMGRDDVAVYLGEPPLSPEPSFDVMAQFPSRRYGLRPQLERWGEDFPYERPAKSGVEFYLEQVARFPGEVSVVVAGPLSTLGRAMQAADARGTGATFRQGIKQVLFSGGDFGTVEYNVYADVEGARLLLHSGIPIYQFGGEGEGKAYLTYGDRQRLWSAETPATWALQDVYRLYRAGWDPRSPFVPILYDLHPIAFLIEGETISRFEPEAVDVNADGRLVHVEGVTNVHVRVANRGPLLVDFAIARMTSGKVAAVNHLRALERMVGPGSADLAMAIDSVIARLGQLQDGDSAAVAGLLDGVGRGLSALGERAERARWHLEMARRFLLGEPRSAPWHDPYTPRVIAVVIPLCKAAVILVRAAPALLVMLSLVLLAFLVRKVQRSRRTLQRSAVP